MSSESYLVRRNTFIKSKNANGTADRSELDRSQVVENEVDSLVEEVLPFDERKNDEAQFIKKP